MKMITNLRDNTNNNVYISFAPKFIPDYLENDQKHHTEILDAVRARLPERVERLLKDIIDNTGKIMTEYLKNPDNLRNETMNSFDNG